MSNDKTTMKGMRANEMTPAFPTHPGDVLKDEIEYRGISQRQLAEEMGDCLFCSERNTECSSPGNGKNGPAL